MKYVVTIIFALFVVIKVHGQVKFSFPVDTVLHEGDSIILFSDKTWEYLNKMDFDGVLNEDIFNFASSDSSFNLIGITMLPLAAKTTTHFLKTLYGYVLLTV
jgi:hypothetical protein